MSEFEAALQAALQGGVTQAFEEADRDLHREVAAAARVIEKMTNGELELRLHPTRESPEGVAYALRLTGEHLAVEQCEFTVPANGYPIAVSDRHNGAGPEGLSDREAVRQYLTRVAGDLDSPLVKGLAFHLRRKER